MKNLDAFFLAVRHAFGNLTQEQVDGINAIVTGCEAQGFDPRWTAYCLSTAWHESATHMQPVIETRQPGEAANPPVDEAIRRLEVAWRSGRMPWVRVPYWRKDADNLSWLGRGLEQTTWRANYAALEKLTGVLYTKNPDLALVPEHAVTKMLAGMKAGVYTGKKLGDYFNAAVTNWYDARRIINGVESAAKVAGYARAFYGALVAGR